MHLPTDATDIGKSMLMTARSCGLPAGRTDTPRDHRSADDTTEVY
jgi:hypothetical protein